MKIVLSSIENFDKLGTAIDEGFVFSTLLLLNNIENSKLTGIGYTSQRISTEIDFKFISRIRKLRYACRLRPPLEGNGGVCPAVAKALPIERLRVKRNALGVAT